MADGAENKTSQDLSPAAEGRRRLLGLVAGAAVGISVLPASWSTPIVGTIVVPAHAAVSPVSASVSASSVVQVPSPTPTGSVAASASVSASTPAPTPSRSAAVVQSSAAVSMSASAVAVSVSATRPATTPTIGRRPSA